MQEQNNFWSKTDTRNRNRNPSYDQIAKSSKSLQQKENSYTPSNKFSSHKTPKGFQAYTKGLRVPIPFGNLPYAKAKRAEYLQHNFQRAKYFYKKAIETNDRAESAVKDLASLLHQKGKTQEAIRLMEQYQGIVTEEPEKYNNLLANLRKQSSPSSNSLNKCLKLTELNEFQREDYVLSLFTNSSRILKIKFQKEKSYYTAFIYFQSHSSARKTLEGFKFFDTFLLEWVSTYGEVIGDANPAKHKKEQRKRNPPFEYLLFERDPDNWVLPLPIDGDFSTSDDDGVNESFCKQLIGVSLYDEMMG